MTYLAALQTTLAAEHAAVYVLGALGGQTSVTQAPALAGAIADAYARHRRRRDLLVARIVGLGARPVASAVAYELPADLGSVAAVTRRALALERAAAVTYAALVAHSPVGQRQLAVEALNETAVRELAFRGTPEMFPGSDEHADR